MGRVWPRSIELCIIWAENREGDSGECIGAMSPVEFIHYMDDATGVKTEHGIDPELAAMNWLDAINKDNLL